MKAHSSVYATHLLAAGSGSGRAGFVFWGTLPFAPRGCVGSEDVTINLATRVAGDDGPGRVPAQSCQQDSLTAACADT